MKYVGATLVSIAALFLFAIFAVAVGWRHGGGYIVQAALWSIIAVLWGAIVRNWDGVLARVRRGGKGSGDAPVLDDNAKFTVLAGLILIVGLSIFFAIRSSPGTPKNARSPADCIRSARQQIPEYASYSDEVVLYDQLVNHPGAFLIIKSDGSRWRNQ